MEYREEWKRQAELHRDEDYGTTCDACLYITEMYDRIVELEGMVAGLHDEIEQAAVETGR